MSLPTRLVRRGEAEPIEMLDASYRGLLLRIPNPPQLRELVKLRVSLPGDRELVMHAVAVRVVGESNGAMHVGMRFFALNGEDRTIWEGFIQTVVHARAARANRDAA